MANRLTLSVSVRDCFLEQARLNHMIEARIEFLHLKQIDLSETKAAYLLVLIVYFVHTTISFFD